MSLVFLICVMAPGYAWCETVYVKPVTAKILSKPAGAGATVVATVRQGEPLTVLERVGKYYRVKTRKGVIGYIMRSRVTGQKISGAQEQDRQEDDLDKLLGILGGGQRTASMEESSSSHSIRGLKRKNVPGRSGVTNRQAEAFVKRMEKFSLSGGEIKQFQREGKVGAYAR